MAWVKVPSENHPVFRAALPKDPRVETVKMFGGVAAKVNGNLFAGLFGRSTMIWLPEPDRAAALALDGATSFDPMGNGRVRSDKVMLPEKIMQEPSELRRWIASVQGRRRAARKGSYGKGRAEGDRPSGVGEEVRREASVRETASQEASGAFLDRVLSGERRARVL